MLQHGGCHEFAVRFQRIPIAVSQFSTSRFRNRQVSRIERHREIGTAARFIGRVDGAVQALPGDTPYFRRFLRLN